MRLLSTYIYCTTLYAVFCTSRLVDSIEETFTNDWIVKIDGGLAVADRLAMKHGFINRGQINDMEYWYHFVLPSESEKRNYIYNVLSLENAVLHVEQQLVKHRVKRTAFSLPTDPLWNAQWYLNSESNGNGSNRDMNVQWAWEQGITGKGVVVTILDDGLERNNPDLKANYDPEASYDFNDHDDDPNPRYDPTDENKHGTRCAGEVASAKNDVCAVGAAYQSSIGGIRMLDASVTDLVEGCSLSFRSQHIDIYSSSWGPDDDGLTVDGPGTLAKDAFLNGTSNGRCGLGSIFMWASGNGGANGDSCSCDGYVISIYTIAISSVGQNGDKPWYAEECPATLAVTYSSGSYAELKIVTADIHNRCTRSHTGTSAAAPLAAGIVALALEANPNLTWRDVQHIIVLTSRSEPMKSIHPSDWNTNGAGLDVSHLYGFGLMDATAIVNRARHWETVPEQIKCELHYDHNLRSGNTYNVQVSQSDCNIRYLEHVQAVVTTSTFIQRGDVVIDLTSPSGYISHLLPRRSRDYHTDSFREWPFMSVHHWGENPTGTWKLTASSGHLNSVKFIFYGTSQEPISVGNIPQSCHASCRTGCSRYGPDHCDECVDFQMATNLSCVATCPEGTYQNFHTCRDPSENCTDCPPGNISIQCNYTRDGEYCGDTTTTGCTKCDLPCKKTCPVHCKRCSSPKLCTECSSGFYLYEPEPENCSPTCPPGYYGEDQVCKACISPCIECSSLHNCISCADDYHAHHGTCYPCCSDSSDDSQECCNCNISVAHCPSSSFSSHNPHLSQGTIVIVVISVSIGLAFVLSILFLIYFIYHRRHKKKYESHRMLVANSSDDPTGSDTEEL